MEHSAYLNKTGDECNSMDHMGIGKNRYELLKVNDANVGLFLGWRLRGRWPVHAEFPHAKVHTLLG